MLGAEFVRPDGEQIIGVELPLDAPWPLGLHPSVMYYQPELEAFLRAAAVRDGVDLVLGVGVTSLEQDADGVTVQTDVGVARSRWLVAADGAASPIRKQLGIAFVDQGFDQDWLVLDVRLRRPVPTLPRFVQQVCDRTGRPPMSSATASTGVGSSTQPERPARRWSSRPACGRCSNHG